MHRGSARGGLRARRHRARARARQQLGVRAAAGHRAAGRRRPRVAALHARRRACWRWRARSRWGSPTTAFLSAEHIGEMAAVAAGGVLAVLAAKGRRSYEEALLNERAARRRSDFVAGPGSCSTRRPSPRRCCARSCGWPCPTWPSCASSTSCTTASSARRRPTRPTRARWRCCTPRACATRSTPRGRTPSPSSPRTGRPHLQHEIGAERLRAFAVDEEHLKLMAGAGYATSLAVPLIARGRTIGVLSFMRFGGSAPYDDDRRRAGRRGRAPRRAGPRQRAPVRRAAPHRGPARGGAGQPRRRGDRAGARRHARLRQPGRRGGAGLLVARGGARHAAGRSCSTPSSSSTRTGGPFDLRELPGRHALAGEEPRPTLTQHGRQGDRRGALVGDQGDAGPRRARRGRARGQHHRGRHRRAPGRAPAALPVGGEHARLLLAGHRRDARQGRAARRCPSWPTGAASTCPTSAASCGARPSAPATPTATALERMRDALSMDADDPGSPAHVLRTGRAASLDRRLRRRRRAGLGRRRRGARRRAAGQRHALGDGRPDGGGRPRHRRRHPRDLAQRAAAGRGRAGAGRRARAPRRHRGGERAPARRALADRHHAAAQPAAAAPAGRAGRHHRRALSRRRARRARSAATSTTSSASATRGWSWSATSPARGRPRPPSPRWRATRCAPRPCTSARRAPCWRASTRRWPPTPSAARSAPRCARASSPPRTGRCGSPSRAAAIRRPS